MVKTKDSPGNVNGSSVVNDLWTSFKGPFVSIVDIYIYIYIYIYMKVY